jgi:hypothetical protein
VFKFRACNALERHVHPSLEQERHVYTHVDTYLLKNVVMGYVRNIERNKNVLNTANNTGMYVQV